MPPLTSCAFWDKLQLLRRQHDAHRNTQMRICVHSMVTRGVFLDDGSWHPIPYVDAHKTELPLQAQRFSNSSKTASFISQERIDLLLSWRNSGFAVHNQTTVYPSIPKPSQARLLSHASTGQPVSAALRCGTPRYSSMSPKRVTMSTMPKPNIPLDSWPARSSTSPTPNKHLVRFYGAYANRVRSEKSRNHSAVDEPEGTEEVPPQRRALRKRWAELVYRIYEVDPLTCP